MARIARKLVQHFLNCTPTTDATYAVLGRDLEDFTVDFNADIEKSKNILGANSIAVKGYEKEASVEPFIADEDDPVYPFLKSIIDEEKVLDDVKTDVVKVELFGSASAGAYPATKEEVFIEVVAEGGDTTGYQVPFNIHFTGERTKGTFNPTTKQFTSGI